MARPTKLTPDVHERIITAIKLGNYTETAVISAGVDKSTHYRWMAKGKTARTGPCREYHDAVIRAQAEAEASAVTTIRKAAYGGDWRASAWWLERKAPERWGRSDRVEVETLIRRESEKIASEEGRRAEEVESQIYRALGKA